MYIPQGINQRKRGLRNEHLELLHRAVYQEIITPDEGNSYDLRRGMLNWSNQKKWVGLRPFLGVLLDSFWRCSSVGRAKD